MTLSGQAWGCAGALLPLSIDSGMQAHNGKRTPNRLCSINQYLQTDFLYSSPLLGCCI